MVGIKKINRNKCTYYYLEHTIRKEDGFEKKELYLGKTLPKNLEEIKKGFLSEIYKEKWYPLLDDIKNSYRKEELKIPEIARKKALENFTIRFTYDTQRIEGSTLTLKETAMLLEEGITPKFKPIDDAKEAEAHKKVFYEILDYKKDLSLDIMLYWHKKLFEYTKTKIAGKIRNHQVAISGSRFMPPFPAEVYPLLREFFKWYEKEKGKLHPVELAGLVHLKFVTIHPFTDGNGRMSRLLMNFVLNKYSYPLLNIHYENRAGYYNALERSHMKKDDRIFIQWFFRRYIKEYKYYLGQ